MLSPEFVKITRCLHTGASLRIVEAPLLEQINAAIAKGTLLNQMGQPVSQKLDEGLIGEDGQFVYPVYDDIPVLLSGEAIRVDQLKQ